MPVQRISKRVSEESQSLVDRLAGELKGEKSEDPKPYVLVEGDEANGPLHIYVVWEEWESLAMQERSSVVMEAYKTCESPENVLRVTVAMGLTPEEAPRYGIDVSRYFSSKA